jgi:ATP-dependent protease ClpP protease subunit
MAQFLSNEFAKYRDLTQKMVLILNSPGGSVEEGERVIDVLRDIRLTHRLETAVFQGATCASMCVPIFLQGRERYAAGSSLWVFHEASAVADGDEGRAVADDEETLRLFRSYYVRAGVRVAWLNEVLAKIANGHNFWQTGQQLMAANTGIITRELSDVTERPELNPIGAPEAKRQAPAQVGRRMPAHRR